MCTYHGWTFATDGKLVGVPGYKEAYFEELDRSQWGLVEVAQIDSYKGLVFATWDRQAPSLGDYLGDIAWYLDMTIDCCEGGTEVIGSVQKWVTNANWKFPTDNLGGDGYHFNITHGSIASLRKSQSFNRQAPIEQTRPQTPQKYRQTHWQVSPGNGHGLVYFGGDNVLDPDGKDNPRVDMKYYTQRLPEMRRRLGDVRADNAVAQQFLSIFPNFSIGGSTLRAWHPKGPGKTENWRYLVADRKAPKEVKEAIRKHQTNELGPSGNVEQDDEDNYIACTASGRMWKGRLYPANIQLKLGREQSNELFPGKAVEGHGELNQRDFYYRWSEIMGASGWSQISIKPRSYKEP
jgi:hypothetical protein